MKPFLIIAAMAAILTATTAASQDTGTDAVSTREVTIFFDDGGVLKPEIRDIPHTTVIEPEIMAVMEQLIDGSKRYTRTLPRNAKLIRAFVDSRNIIYLDFNSRLKKDHPGGIACELLTVASIARTIFSNFDAGAVQIMVDGREIETLAGHIYTGKPFTREEVRKWARENRKKRK